MASAVGVLGENPSMEKSSVDEILRTLDVLPEGDGGSAELSAGRSGAVVVPGMTADGLDVVVKIDASSRQRRSLGARRELAWYQKAGAEPGDLFAPRLLRSEETDTWAALVLERMGPPSMTDWDARRWGRLADLLAALHRSGASIEAPARDEVLLDIVRDEDQIVQLCSPRQVVAYRGLSPRIDAVISAAPRALIHGDCHLENVVVAGDGSLRLVDWQSAGEGPAAADLAFALTRAITSPVAVPREEAIIAYARAAGREVTAVDGEVTALQLRTLVRQFPMFRSFLPGDGVRRLRTSITELTGRFDAMVIRGIGAPRG